MKVDCGAAGKVVCGREAKREKMMKRDMIEQVRDAIKWERMTKDKIDQKGIGE